MASVPAPSATASAIAWVLPLWDQKTTAALLMRPFKDSSTASRVDLFAMSYL